MNQKELRNALQTNLPEPPDGFDVRSDYLLSTLAAKEETHVKKISLGFVFALVLVLLTLTALAATLSGWSISDFIRNVEHGSVPEGFESGFRQDLAMEVDGVCFRIRDAFAADGHAVTLTEVSMKDGSPAVFALAYDDPETEPAARYLTDPSEAAKGETVREYAARKNLPLIPVSVGIDAAEQKIGSLGLYKIEDDCRTVFYTDSYYDTENRKDIRFAWEAVVYPRFGAVEDDPDRKAGNSEFSLPVSALESRTIPVGKEISGPAGAVTVDALKIDRSSVETVLTVDYHTAGDADALEGWYFSAVRPGTLMSFPEVFGSSMPEYRDDEENGGISGTYKLSLNLPAEADTVLLRFGQYLGYQAQPQEEVISVRLTEPYECRSTLAGLAE